VAEPNGAGAPRQAIRLLAQRARHALGEAGAFVRSRAVPLVFDNGPGRKWHLFADQPIDSTETCAISCAVTTLIAIGERPDTPLISEALRTLLLLELPSGGWTSWINNLDDLAAEDPEQPLIIDTYFALYALNALGLENSEPFARGVEWFRRAQDAAVGAWGFHPGAEPQVLPTSMAIVALSFRGQQSEPLVRDVVNRGVEWLLNRQLDGEVRGWSNRENRPASAVHTAWALRALTAAGHDPYSPPIVAAREWLLDHIADRESIIDHYVAPGRTLAGRVRASRAITHINFADGIIVHGLLRAGANVLDPRLLTAVDTLIRAQEREGYWRCLHSPREQPIYAVMDACIALRLFVDTVQRHESVLEVSERIQQHEAVVTALSTASAATVSGLADLNARLDEIIRRLDEQDSRWRALEADTVGVRTSVDRLSVGLAALHPVMWLTRLIARWPVLTLLVVLQVIAYSLAAFTVPPEYRAMSWLGGALLTLVTAITYWAQSRPGTPPST